VFGSFGIAGSRMSNDMIMESVRMKYSTKKANFTAF